MHRMIQKHSQAQLDSAKLEAEREPGRFRLLELAWI